ncbi:MAG: class I SAM-dependent methyltransferase, partial [Ruminococcus sp.]|nr:class I SAM-dependent methyltransferase [Ruminococcus sp.]
MNELEKSITEQGNPAKPHGIAGEQMLTRMNVSHYDVTGWALDFFEFSGNENVLDIGCGGGETLRRMAEKITSGHLTGLDYSPLSVKMSNQHNAESISCGKMNIVEASVEKMPFYDNFFDRIITVESFYFWKNPPENLKEVYRVLAEKGVFLIVADRYG